MALVSTTTHNSHIKLLVCYWKEDAHPLGCVVVKRRPETGGSGCEDKSLPRRTMCAPIAGMWHCRNQCPLSVLLSLRDGHRCRRLDSAVQPQFSFLPAREPNTCTVPPPHGLFRYLLQRMSAIPIHLGELGVQHPHPPYCPHSIPLMVHIPIC